jgi:hypothetical protein
MRKNHGKTSVRVRKTSARLRKPQSEYSIHIIKTLEADEYNLISSEHRWKDFDKGKTAVFRLKTTVFRLKTTVFLLKTAVFRLKTALFRPKQQYSD